MGEDEVKLTRKNLEWSHDEFIIPEELLSEWRSFAKRNEEIKKKWKNNNADFLNSTKYKKYFNTT